MASSIARLPRSVARWGDETGRHFVFAWKASKFISHWKRLTENSTNSLQLLEHWLSILGEKVGQFSFSCRRTSLRTQVGLAASRSRTRSGPMQKSGWENCTRTRKQTVWKTSRQRSRSLMSGRAASRSMWEEKGVVPTMLPAARSPPRNNSELQLVAFGGQRQRA